MKVKEDQQHVWNMKASNDKLCSGLQSKDSGEMVLIPVPAKSKAVWP